MLLLSLHIVIIIINDVHDMLFIDNISVFVERKMNVIFVKVEDVIGNN